MAFSKKSTVFQGLVSAVFGQWSHLVLPLAGHNFPVCSGDFDAGKEARLVVSLHDVAAEGVLIPDGTVVRSLMVNRRQMAKSTIEVRVKRRERVQRFS